MYVELFMVTEFYVYFMKADIILKAQGLMQFEIGSEIVENS